MIKAQGEKDYEGYDKVTAGWGINNGSVRGYFVTEQELRECWQSGKSSTISGISRAGDTFDQWLAEQLKEAQ